jgi:very-short-patch-repair endonuclease
MLAKALRYNLTQSETILWVKLRECNGLKFRRQQPIGAYIVDFVCFDANLIVEIDGGQHNEPCNKEKDEQRTEWLKSQGFQIARFWNNDVLENVEGIVHEIMEHAKK